MTPATGIAQTPKKPHPRRFHHLSGTQTGQPGAKPGIGLFVIQGLGALFQASHGGARSA